MQCEGASGGLAPADVHPSKEAQPRYHTTRWSFNCGWTPRYTPQCPFWSGDRKNPHFLKDIKNLRSFSGGRRDFSFENICSGREDHKPLSRRDKVSTPKRCGSLSVCRVTGRRTSGSSASADTSVQWSVTPSAFQPETSLLSDSDSPQWNNHSHSNQCRLQSVLLTYSYYLVLKKKKNPQPAFSISTFQ